MANNTKQREEVARLAAIARDNQLTKQEREAANQAIIEADRAKHAVTDAQRYRTW